MSNILQKAQQTVAASGVPQQLMRGAGALQGSIENTRDPKSMVIDPRTGQRSNTAIANTAIRSLATVPVVQEYMDQLIGSQYGALIPQLADNPAIKQQLIRKLPFAKTAVDTIMDRINQKRFAGMKHLATQNAAGILGDITQKHIDASQVSSGQNLAAKAMQRHARFYPQKNLSRYDLLRQARQESQYSRGTDLSDREQEAILGLGEAVEDRAYKKKGLNILYTRKKGGLAAQRARAGLDEIRKQRVGSTMNLAQTQQALSQAQDKFNQIVSARGPSLRAEGGRINVGKFMDLWDSGKPKTASMKELAACFRNIVDKIASDVTFADSEGMINSLSSRDFSMKSETKPKVFNRRELQKEGGIPSIVNNILYSDTRNKTDLKSTLKANLRKIKKELYFKDNINYTIGK